MTTNGLEQINAAEPAIQPSMPRPYDLQMVVLTDNVPADGLSGEWGLSIALNYLGTRILLDTGASPLFLKNAEMLNIKISEMEHLVLSHAHFDHANGIPAFFGANEKASLYLPEGSGEDCYFHHLIISKYIGIPRGMLEKHRDRIIYTNGVTELRPGVYLVPHSTPGLEAIGKREKMYRRVKRFHYVPDNFAHEQSLVFRTVKGLVIFNSCSHGGAATIIRETMQAFPDQKVHALIGGFHLYNKKEEEVRALAKEIKATGIDTVFTGHCTGKKSYAVLREELGQQLQPLHTGLRTAF